MKPQYPSLVFPDTDIFNDRQFPLMVFGSPLYYLLPVESDPDQGAESDQDCFINRGLCQPLTPAPLGEHRNRFLRLVHDIETRKDDYASQLSALTVAAMGSKKKSGEDEQRHQIVSSLIGDDISAAEKDKEKQTDLWQARLVLAIGELLKREESELRQELQMLDAQEVAMFRSIQGDGDDDEPDPFQALEKLASDLDNARPREQKMQFKSWLTLMAAAPLPPVLFWLASSADAADQIFNHYEKTSDLPIRPILEIPLPDRIAASPVYVADQILAFQQDAAEPMRSLLEALAGIGADSDLTFDSANDLLPVDSEQLTTWNELLDAHFPSGSHGRASLVFYLLPQCEVAEMFDLTSTADTQPKHSLIAVLKRG